MKLKVEMVKIRNWEEKVEMVEQKMSLKMKRDVVEKKMDKKK